MCAWEAAGLSTSAGCSPGWVSPAGQPWAEPRSPAAYAWAPHSLWVCNSCSPLVIAGVSLGAVLAGMAIFGSTAAGRATPAWQHQARGPSVPCTRCGSPWRAGSWSVSLRWPWALWAGLFTAWPPLVTHDRFSQLFLNAATLCRKCERPPALYWTEKHLYNIFRHGLSSDGLHLCWTLSYIVFLSSAALVMCTFTTCGFSHSPSEPGEAAVRAVASSCLCCILHPPSSLSSFPSPFCQGAIYKYGQFIFGVLIAVLGLFFLLEIGSGKPYPLFNFPCFISPLENCTPLGGG